MTAILLNDGEIAAASPERGNGLFKGGAMLKIKGRSAKNKFVYASKVQNLHIGQCAKTHVLWAFFAFAKIF
jgi:hypothetical protein